MSDTRRFVIEAGVGLSIERGGSVTNDGEHAGHPFRGNQYKKGHGNDPNSGMKKVDTNSEAFKSWFDGSKVVGEDGRPIVCYHGTNVAGIQSFHTERDGVIYFTPSTSYGHVQNSEHVIPVYLQMKNPFHTEHQPDVEGAGSWPDWIAELKRKGHDGIIYSKKGDLLKGPSGWGNDHPQYAVFHPSQIKSAISNTGNFGKHGVITDSITL